MDMAIKESNGKKAPIENGETLIYFSLLQVSFCFGKVATMISKGEGDQFENPLLES